MPRQINNFQETNFEDPRLLRRYDRWIDRSNTRYQTQSRLPPDADAAAIARFHAQQKPAPKPQQPQPQPVSARRRSRSHRRHNNEPRLFEDSQQLGSALLRQQKRRSETPLTFADVWKVEHNAAKIWNTKIGQVPAPPTHPRNTGPIPFSYEDAIARGYPPIENYYTRGLYSAYLWDRQFYD
eukprot:TRINITY_DN2667_c0_g1_i1.p2 TRINITY_DN2667_c0_g1~~TRINITY_DN2667_c0_g1_i1.p2  ORF type:complete len:182 (+),score=23.29 TRINITY_DN2667_c0_g1_i1:38-583(+)